MERKTFFAKRGGANTSRPETFAIRVEGYDVNAKPPVVHGVRLDNDERVSVSLRDITYKQTGRFKRSEIADFAAPRKSNQHPGTSEGGSLLIQEAFKDGDGRYGARWIQSLSHTDGEAEVFMATIHVTPVKRGRKTEQFPDGRPYSQMTIMYDGDFRHLSQEMADALKLTPPFKVDSVDELREAVTDLLNDGLGVGVRVSNADGFDAMYVGRKTDATTEESVAAFLKDVEPIADAINAGEAVCEVIPYGNMFAGPATVDVMQKNPVVQSRLVQFNSEGADDKGRNYPVSVYRPAVVAARLTAPGADGQRAVFFSQFEPVWTRQPVHGLVNALCHARTEHLAPEPPKLNMGDAAQPAASSAGAAPEESGNFEAGIADDDLVGAADAAAGADFDIGDDIPAVEQPLPQPEPEPKPRSSRYAGRR